MIHNEILGRCILIKTFFPVYIWFWTKKRRMTQHNPKTRNFIFPNFLGLSIISAVLNPIYFAHHPCYIETEP